MLTNLFSQSDHISTVEYSLYVVFWILVAIIITILFLSFWILTNQDKGKKRFLDIALYLTFFLALGIFISLWYNYQI